MRMLDPGKLMSTSNSPFPAPQAGEDNRYVARMALVLAGLEFAPLWRIPKE